MGDNGGRGSILGIVLVIICAIALLGSCSGSETQYDRDYKSGIDKFNHGNTNLTDGEKKAVDNYLKWQNDQHK